MPTPKKPTAAKAPEEKNYYEMLEVAQNATVDEIRTAVKKQRTLWSNRVARGGSMGDRARKIVARIGEAEKVLFDAAARAEYDKGLIDEPIVTAPAVQAGETDWLAIAYQYYDQEDWEMAHEAATKATSQQPTNAGAWFLAAVICEKLNNFSQANQAAKQVLLLEPDNPYAYEVRGDVLWMNKNNARQAREQYRKMKECAQSRGDGDAAAVADEKMVMCEFDVSMVPRINDLANRYNRMTSNGNDVRFNKDSMAQMETLLNELYDVRRKSKDLLGQIKRPSQAFRDDSKEYMDLIEGNIQSLEEVHTVGKDLCKKPLIINGVLLVVLIFATLIAGPIAGLLGWCVMAIIVNYMVSGYVGGKGLFFDTESGLKPHIGSMRVIGWCFGSGSLSAIIVYVCAMIHG
jgi:tetratricopeptide (TPR) repeat protein